MWHRCAEGTWWGRHGAAGVAIRSPATEPPRLLLQRRAAWTHGGGTWGVPGGALERGEGPLDGALREAAEEGVEVLPVGEVRDVHVHEPCPHWSYTTLLWVPAGPVRTRSTSEATAYRWIRPAEVAGLALHPGLAATLQATGWLDQNWK